MTDTRSYDDMLDALVPAAENLLTAGRRYPDITVSELAAAAGVPRWRFYDQFRDKHEFLRAWFGRLNDAVALSHDPWLEIDDWPTRAELRAAVRELYLPYVKHGALHAAMYDSDADTLVRAELDRTEQARIDALRAHIARGQQQGWVDPDLLAEETAEWLVLTGARGYQRMVLTTDGMDFDDFVISYADFVWRILYAPARRANGGTSQRS